MADYTDFVKYIHPDVMGCPEIAITDAVRDSIITFCEETHIWVGDEIAVDIVKGQRTYPLTSTPDEYIFNVDKVIYNGYTLSPTSVNELESAFPEWRRFESDPTNFYYYRQAINLVGLPAKDETGALIVQPVVRPTRTSSTVPDWMFEEWVDGVAAYAKYKLHSMSNKPWTDPNKASSCYVDYTAYKTKARVMKEKSYGKVSRTVEPVRFGG